MMATPRRISYINTPSFDTNTTTYQIRHSYVSSMLHFLKRPHSLPFVLTIFLLLTWISLRMHHASKFSSSMIQTHLDSTINDDMKANLVRFKAQIPSESGLKVYRHRTSSKIVKDKRGWSLDPLSLASDSGISGGALTCASIHAGEIRPGTLRGNHRHHDCNETLVIWGATTIYRLENSNVPNVGYAEVTIGSDDVIVAASPRGTAHAIKNIDPIRSTFFFGCQDSIISYNASSTDFNVWKDL
ncbi:unnamed protein product [Lupinus luteus]|uniref:Cupin type-1 domain-containing protein n=1 Tax=Lupinus luteus TaxID=3873 RepID=A0AAV1VQL6_LUPLU